MGKNLRFENSGAELKMSREQQEVYIKYLVLQFAKMELRTYFWRTPKRRRKKPLTRYGQRLLEGPIIYLFDMEDYRQDIYTEVLHLVGALMEYFLGIFAQIKRVRNTKSSVQS